MKMKITSLMLIVMMILSCLPLGVTTAYAADTAVPKVDFSNSSIATASGLEYSTSYKYGNSAGSTRYYTKAKGKESKVFAFSNYGISSDWTYGDTIVIPIYNKYAVNNKVNIILSRGTTSSDKTTAGYVSYKLLLNWTGWKVVKIPKTSFGKNDSPVWSNVNSIFFNMGGWNEPAPTGTVDFYVDSVYLTSNASSGESFVDMNDPLVTNAMGLEYAKATSSDSFFSGRFTASGESKFTNTFELGDYCISSDWSGYKTVDFKIYNVNANNQKLNIIFNKRSDTNVKDGYCYYCINLDWTGWKTVSVPIVRFSYNYGMTAMKDFGTIFFNVGGWPEGSPVANNVDFYIASISGSTNAQLVADAIGDSCAVYVNSTKALKELSAVTLPNPTIYIGNKIFAPLSLFAKLFGASSGADTLDYNSMKLKFTDGSDVAKIGAYTHKLSGKACIQNDEIYVPLSDLCEIFGIPLHMHDRIAVMGSDSDIEFIKAYYDRGVNEVNEQIAEKLSPLSETSVTDEDCEQVIENWLVGIVGNEELNDLSNSAVNSKITSVNTNAESARKLLIKSENSSELFSDQKSTETTHMTATASRINKMALAYGTYGAELYHNEELLADILYSLEWFYQNRYGINEINGKGWHSTSGFNWHDWKIGTPSYLIPTLMIVRDSLTDEQITNYLKCFNHVSPSTYSSGANYMDACELIVGAAALEKNAARIMDFKNKAEEAFVYVQNSRQLESQLDAARQKYTPNKGHGFYTDGSYVYHTLHAMNGTYGMSHLNSASEIALLFDGTKFEIAKPYIDNMADWIVNAFDSGTYGIRMMRMFLGRGENPSETSVPKSVLIAAVKCFDLFDEEDQIRIGSIIKRYSQVNPSSYASSVGLEFVDKYNEIISSDLYDEYRYDFANVFGNIDKVLQRRTDWGIGISMSSSRIFNYESINNLNKNGWYLGDGRTELILNEEAGKSATPYWKNVNYYRLPGTTVDTQARKLATVAQGNEYLSSKDFVGGVELGEKYSTAAMHLESYHNESDFGKNGGDYGGPNPAHQSDLTAKKSYFMFDNEIYCLGTEINATNNNNAEVLTVFENRPGDMNGTSRIKIDKAGENKESECFDFKKYGAGSDWSKATTIRIPIYSKVANQENLNIIISKDALDTNYGYMFKKQTIDWSGWKVVDIPTSSFSKSRGIKDWSDMNSMKFNIGGWLAPDPQATTDLYFGDVQALDANGNVLHTVPYTSSLVATSAEMDFTTDVLYGNATVSGRMVTNNGNVSLAIGKDTALGNVSWVNANNNVGYVFPDSSMNGTIKASMTSAGYFEGIISHGVNPENGSYVYGILPNMNAEETKAYAENPDVEILSNTPDVQAVRYKKENITSIVFWNAGTFDYITVSQPMMVMIKDDGGKMTLAVSDPTHKLETATISLAKSFVLSYADERITQTGSGSKLTLTVDFTGTLGASLEAEIKGLEPVISSVVFADASGKEISQYVSQNEATVSATVSVTNLGTSAYSYKVFAALYSGEGTLESVQTSSVDLLAAGRKRNTKLTITPTSNTKRIEIFVWDKGSIIKPCGRLYRN